MIKKFQASNMQEAIKLIRNSLGPDAVILSTRNIRGGGAPGYQGKPMVEVTARLDHAHSAPEPSYTSRPLPPPIRPSSPAVRRPSSIQQEEISTLRNQKKALGTIIGPIQDEIEDLRKLMQSLMKPGNSDRDKERENELLRADIEEMKSMLKLGLEGGKAPGPGASLHDGLAQVYKEMVRAKINEAFAMRLTQNVSAAIPEEHYKHIGVVKAHIAQEMMKSIKVGGPIRLKKGTTKIAAFVGPTGVGKTTTIAKLAADFTLVKKASVALITLDTYRVAAVEQLKTYARILKIPIAVIVNENELERAVNSFEQKDLILIDTAGRSKKDQAQLTALVDFLGVDLPIEVHLVLSSTASEESILAAYSKFHPISIDRLLFTKLDESIHYGMIYNVAKKTNKPISYFTTGQKVPEDIERAEAETLVQLILNLKRTK